MKSMECLSQIQDEYDLPGNNVILPVLVLLFQHHREPSSRHLHESALRIRSGIQVTYLLNQKSQLFPNLLDLSLSCRQQKCELMRSAIRFEITILPVLAIPGNSRTNCTCDVYLLTLMKRFKYNVYTVIPFLLFSCNRSELKKKKTIEPKPNFTYLESSNANTRLIMNKSSCLSQETFHAQLLRNINIIECLYLECYISVILTILNITTSELKIVTFIPCSTLVIAFCSLSKTYFMSCNQCKNALENLFMIQDPNAIITLKELRLSLCFEKQYISSCCCPLFLSDTDSQQYCVDFAFVICILQSLTTCQ